MQYVTLPGTDLKVSRIALGGWTFAGGGRWGEVDDEESIAAIREAVGSGMNMIDTAEVYGDGHSEEVIGSALQGIRDKAVVATKVHYNGGHYRYNALLQSCENSLKRLRTDYIDLYQLHWPGFSDETEENVGRALEKLKTDGKIRYYGVCNFGVRQLESFHSHAKPITNQLPYSILWRAIEQGIVEDSVKHDMGILAYSAMHSGVLSGKYRTLEEIPEERAGRNAFASDLRKRLIVDVITKLFALAETHGVTMRQLALGWVLEQRGVTAVLAGARNVAQVKENVALSFEPVPTPVWNEISCIIQ